VVARPSAPRVRSTSAVSDSRSRPGALAARRAPALQLDAQLEDLLQVGVELGDELPRRGRITTKFSQASAAARCHRPGHTSSAPARSLTRSRRQLERHDALPDAAYAMSPSESVRRGVAGALRAPKSARARAALFPGVARD